MRLSFESLMHFFYVFCLVDMDFSRNFSNFTFYYDEQNSVRYNNKKNWN